MPSPSPQQFISAIIATAIIFALGAYLASGVPEKSRYSSQDSPSNTTEDNNNWNGGQDNNELEQLARQQQLRIKHKRAKPISHQQRNANITKIIDRTY